MSDDARHCGKETAYCFEHAASLLLRAA
jgi:hypothetical protein